ncbi:MAG: peptidase [Idiomarina sp.]|uniref:alpha/beta hydrolase n=1 Tax=Idiomarina sp. TaxID=1874361 RepID=UPI000C5DF916|nr:alpha/beta hydrolase [Idiomarina sp.]MBT40909.1 peptidase [Idiomarina sp.]
MRSAWHYLETLGLVALGLLISATSITASANQDTSQETAEPCFINGVDERLNCGFVKVPENYNQADGKQIAIHYAVLPAISEGKRSDPLLILAGGPGQAATELTPMIAKIFEPVRKTRDIVLIDQRGTGKSNPLQCEVDHADELLQTDDAQSLTKLAAGCLQKFEDTDTLQYTTLNSIKDFEQVREHLGIKQFNLYGGSYGTRVGLKYLQHYPDSVRTATLDAVAPPQVVIGPFGLHASLAFNKLVEDCNQQLRCEQRFPNVKNDYQQVMQALDEQPQRLQINDPLTNQPTDILLSSGRFSSIIRLALYSPMTRQLLPFTINEAAAGNFQPVLGLMGSTTVAAQNSIYLGLMLSVLCSEDLPRADAQLLAQDANNDFIGGRTGEAFQALCKAWPADAVAAEWAAPVESDKPVLLLSGTQDPVTPPRWGDIAARTLTNSAHFVAEHASHTIASHTCANKIIADFIEAGSVQDLSGECLKKRVAQPFVLNVNGEGL